MGTSPSVVGFNLTKYQFINEVIDPRFGQIKIYQQNETGETICVIEKVLTHVNKPFRKLEHQNLLKVYHYKAEIKSELCSQFTRLSIVYEYVNNELRSNINSRAAKRAAYSEEQLWGLLMQCLSVLRYLKAQNIYPLDLKNLMLSNQGTVKLHSLLDNHMSSFMQVFNNLTQDMHLSPEELDSLRSGKLDRELDYEKCEVFQLGMTALWAASLADTNSIYSQQTYEYSVRELNDRISELNYSNHFKNTLANMLSADPNERKSFDHLITEIESLHDWEEDLLKICRPKKEPTQQVDQSAPFNMPFELNNLKTHDSNFKASEKQNKSQSQTYKPSFIENTSRTRNEIQSQQQPPNQDYEYSSFSSQKPPNAKSQLTIMNENTMHHFNHSLVKQNSSAQSNMSSYRSHKLGLDNRIEEALNRSKQALQKFNMTVMNQRPS